MSAVRAKLVLQGSVAGQSTRKQWISVYVQPVEIFYILKNGCTYLHQNIFIHTLD